MAPHVVVRDLRKSYDRVDAVRGVSFTVEPGEVFGLLGPNGAGKTTTVECLIGLREPDGGELEVCGLDARKHPQEVKQKIGVALQSTSLQDKITPREALSLFGSFYRDRIEPKDRHRLYQVEGVWHMSSDDDGVSGFQYAAESRLKLDKDVADAMG